MDNAVIGGLLGIIAALLAGLFGIYLPRRNARREAGQQLIEEFAIVERRNEGHFPYFLTAPLI